ncbi:MAG: hypothetical protein ACFFCI_19830 [Promethearchaeota archaeon]
MVTLYESNGNFNSGIISYRAIVSKRSRGKILLTEKLLSFESQIDKILFQIKLSDIQEFSINNKHSIPILELKTTPGDTYSLHPRNFDKKQFHGSQIMTEELFRQLTRLKFNNDQPILFDTVAVIYTNSLQNAISNSSGLQGHMFLTENYILFNPFEQAFIIKIRILDIKEILMQIIESTAYVIVKTFKGEFYYILPLKTHRRRYTKDKLKTEKLYDILNEAQMYKTSETIKLKPQTLDKKLEDRAKPEIECLFCGEKISSDVKICPFCDTNLYEN